MTGSLQIYFVCYYSLACNSGAQIASLATHLVRRGHQVTVFVPFDADATEQTGAAQFQVRLFTDIAELNRTLTADPQARARSLLHVWTTRENVRQLTLGVVDALGLPYVIHLEDNEPLITATNTGVDFAELGRRPAEEVARAVGDRLTSPHHFRAFLAGAAGVTGLIDRLMEFAPPSSRQLVFWPGFDEALFHAAPRNDGLRRQHGIADGEICLVYAGNVASVNAAEVRSLYLAVAVLARLGLPARLVRAGEDYAELFSIPLDEVTSRVINLGRLPHRDMPALFAMADFLVQPGRADPFNDYRFPSKLPEFFATGRPVLLPPTNLGRFVRDGIDAVVLREGHAMEIAEQIAALVRDPARRQDLAEQAVIFARDHFQWSQIASRIEGLYLDVVASAGHARLAPETPARSD